MSQRRVHINISITLSINITKLVLPWCWGWGWGPVMFDKHVGKSLKGFVNFYCFVLKKYPMSCLCERRCLRVRRWRLCFRPVGDNKGSAVKVIRYSAPALGIALLCVSFHSYSWQTSNQSYTHLTSDRATNTSWPFTHRTTLWVEWGTLHATGASPRRPDHEHINPHTHTLTLRYGQRCQRRRPMAW